MWNAIRLVVPYCCRCLVLLLLCMYVFVFLSPGSKKCTSPPVPNTVLYLQLTAAPLHFSFSMLPVSFLIIIYSSVGCCRLISICTCSCLRACYNNSCHCCCCLLRLLFLHSYQPDILHMGDISRSHPEQFIFSLYCLCCKSVEAPCFAISIFLTAFISVTRDGDDYSND